MSYEVPRSVVEAFYQVYAARDADKVAQYLSDDVIWTISGPVDLLPFCGTHRGKAEVVDLIKRQVPRVLRTFSFVAEAILVQGDQAAMLSRQSARRTEDGRAISYRVANFMRFLDGKLVENLSLIDTFDAVEQVLGHQLTVPGGSRSPDNGLVAV
jgi:ketosteroid isomerase-like protein